MATCSLDGLGAAQAPGTTSINAAYDTAGIWTLDAYGADCTWEPFSTSSSAGCTVLKPTFTIESVTFDPKAINAVNGASTITVSVSASENQGNTYARINLVKLTTAANLTGADTSANTDVFLIGGGLKTVTFTVMAVQNTYTGPVEFRIYIVDVVRNGQSIFNDVTVRPADGKKTEAPETLTLIP